MLDESLSIHRFQFFDRSLPQAFQSIEKLKEIIESFNKLSNKKPIVQIFVTDGECDVKS